MYGSSENVASNKSFKLAGGQIKSSFSTKIIERSLLLVYFVCWGLFVDLFLFVSQCFFFSFVSVFSSHVTFCSLLTPNNILI